MEEHAAEDIKHIPLTTVRLPAARSLPLGLADGGHAALRRGEPSCRKSGARSRSGRGGSAGGQRARRLRRRTPHWRCAQQPAHCRVAARAGGWSVRVLVVRVACRLELGEKFILASRGGKPTPLPPSRPSPLSLPAPPAPAPAPSLPSAASASPLPRVATAAAVGSLIVLTAMWARLLCVERERVVASGSRSYASVRIRGICRARRKPALPQVL